MLGWKVLDIATVVDQLMNQGVTFEHIPGMDQDERIDDKAAYRIANGVNHQIRGACQEGSLQAIVFLMITAPAQVKMQRPRQC